MLVKYENQIQPAILSKLYQATGIPELMANEIFIHYGGLHGILSSNPKEDPKLNAKQKKAALKMQGCLIVGQELLSQPIEKSTESLTASEIAFRYISKHIIDIQQETIWVIGLNIRNNPIYIEQVAAGGAEGVNVSIPSIMRTAIRHQVPRIIIAHNHPSGGLNPSSSDIRLTEKIKDAGMLLGVDLVDHLIIGNTFYISLADRGMI